MALLHYQDVVIDNTSKPVSNANVTVYITGTQTLASLFSDINGSNPISNPVVTDSFGRFDFYVAANTYDIKVSGNNIFTYTQTAVAIEAVGPQGAAATITVGTTTTGAPGTSASVTNSGTSNAAIFDFTVPRGDVGATGSQGPSGTISVGSTTTLDSTQSAAVSNSGTSTAAIFNFSIPKGSGIFSGSGAPLVGTGQNGDYYFRTDTAQWYGPKAAGAWGGVVSTLNATVSAGTTTTVDSTQSAAVSNSGTTQAAIFNFTIPRGSVILSGVGAPAAGTGSNGDYYYATDTVTWYGPKAAGAWPTGTLVGGVTATSVTNETNTYQGSTSPSGTPLFQITNANITAYTEGMRLTFKPNFATVTGNGPYFFQVNALGQRRIQKLLNTVAFDIGTGDLNANCIAEVKYNASLLSFLLVEHNSLIAKLHLTSQTVDLPPTTLYSITNAGLDFMLVTQVAISNMGGAVSATVPAVNVTFYDGNSFNQPQTVQVTPTHNETNALGSPSYYGTAYMFNAQDNKAITVSTSGLAGVSGSPSFGVTFNLYVLV